VIETEQRFLRRTTVHDIAIRMSTDAPCSGAGRRKKRPRP
jgi:hypothetical protein